MKITNAILLFLLLSAFCFLPSGVYGQGVIQTRIITTLPAKCSPTQSSGLPAVVWKRSGAQIGFHECLTDHTWTYRGFSVSGTTATGMVYMSALNAITSTAAPTNGQLLVGRTGLVPILATLTGTANETLITNGAGSITLGLAATLNHKVGSSFNFQDPTDATKVFQFNASGITTATTRTITVPDSNTTLPIFAQIITFAGPTAARTYTLPDAAATLARTDAGQTFTGVNVFTRPQVITSLDDSNGNEVFKITATGSAVNEFTFTNAATGNSPTISTTGSDTNINLTLTPKGIGKVVLPNGDAGNPGTVFAVDPTTGFAALSTAVIDVFVNGSRDFQFNGADFFLRADAGDIKFGLNQDAGIARGAAKIISFTDGGAGGGSFSAAATSPAQITSNQNDYNPGGSSYLQRWSSDASRNVTGLTFTAAQVSGQTHMICNIGAQNIVLTHDDGATSTAANRFKLTGAANKTIAADECVLVVYDATTARWRVAS